jgi:hypothetical protein
MAGLSLTLALIANQVYASKAKLLETYQVIQPELEHNVYGLPIFINSNDANKTMVGEVYGTLAYPFKQLKDTLSNPANWCEIIPQHLNIKACTYQHKNGYCEITFYTGRKFYEKADDVYQIQYQYTLLNRTDDHFYINFSAATGPLGTKDYKIEVEAIPLTGNSTFIRFSYAYKFNYLTEFGMNTYLATLGSDKVGFTMTGKDEHEQPVYIDGIRGIIERNSVRYYLAIQSFLETQQLPEEARFAARINKWFDLTEKYHHQLYEMEKQDYLEYKQMERVDQLRLQASINETNSPEKNACKSNMLP